jgi:Flp pilus assembly protein TadD
MFAAGMGRARDAARESRSGFRLAMVCLAALIALAYSNGLHAPFVLDDVFNVIDNPNVRKNFGDADSVGDPINVHTAYLRPFAIWTFALNYAAGGVDPLGYHVVNVAIHVANALLVFALMVEILSSQALRGRFGATAVPQALTIALLWGLHPLQTDAVTYTTQRFESLMTTFYLLTLYAWFRGAAQNHRGWFACACIAGALGMLTKEVMVTVPVALLLLDVCFLTGSWRASSSARRGPLLALTIVIGALALRGLFFVPQYETFSGMRGQGNFWSYLATQPHAVLHYIRLIFWPSPLIFDYGWPAATGWEIVIPGLIVLGLLAVVVWGAWRRRPWAAPLALYFLILAPSSSVIPIFGDYYFEYRAYLPSLAIIAACVVAVEAACETAGLSPSRPSMSLPKVALVSVLAIMLGGLTYLRNQDYRSAQALWADTVQKSPENPRAHLDLGTELDKEGDAAGAEREFREASRLWPDYFEAHYNLGVTLKQRQDLTGAEEEFREVLRLRTNYPNAHNGLGTVLAQRQDRNGAEREFREALRLQPNYPDAHNNLSVTLRQRQDLSGSEEEVREALRLRPNFPEAYYNLGVTLAQLQDLAGAEQEFREALRLRPNFPDAHNNLGVALALQKELGGAEKEFREAMRMQPNNSEAHKNLSVLLKNRHEFAEAEKEWSQYLRLQRSR